MIIIEVHLDEQDYHVLIPITSERINLSGQNEPFVTHIDGFLTIVSSKRWSNATRLPFLDDSSFFLQRVTYSTSFSEMRIYQ